MQLSVFLVSASRLVASVWSAPTMASFSSASPARAMLKRQWENTEWAHVIVARDDHLIMQLDKRIVYNPTITQPSAESIWHAGDIHHVKWSTSDMPDVAQNYTGMVKLGYLPADGEGGENLHWTLAKDFRIDAGIVAVKLPEDLQPRTDYIIVLMGDSGNASPTFSIKAPEPTLNKLLDAGAHVVANVQLDSSNADRVPVLALD